MSITFVTSSLVTTGTTFFTFTSNTDYYVASGVLVASQTGAAFLVGESQHDIWVNGDLFGASQGIAVGDDWSADGFNTVTVAEGSTVQSTLFGIGFYCHDATLINDGAIQGGLYGVQVGGSGSGTSRIENRGEITGGFLGVVADIATSETVRLVNTGTISGGLRSYQGADNPDLVTNRGLMVGDVELRAGDDRFDNRQGAVEGGAIYGGNGLDTFLPGAEAETFDGGAALDSLDFRGGPGGRISLADDSGTGLSEGDTYLGVERVFGSRGGGDWILGDGAANSLFGFGGADTLDGGAGNDSLIGGGAVDDLSGGAGKDLLSGDAGADVLSGGSGNDLFDFSSSAEGGDLIADFGAVRGDDDTISITAFGFGGGLVAGTLAASQFQSRADNLAQDATDRFVFRTTDATLWFDVDGTGAAAPVLIADLQAGASLTAADILIV